MLSHLPAPDHISEHAFEGLVFIACACIAGTQAGLMIYLFFFAFN